MKTSIKLFVMTMAMVGFSYVSLAQQPQQPRKDPLSIEERVNRALKIIGKKIELTQSEKESIKNAFTDFYQKADEELKSGERPERSVMEGFEKDRDHKIKEALSEEKYEDYLRITCYLRPQPPRNNKRNPNAGRPIN